MSGVNTYSQPDSSTQSGSQYKTNIDKAIAVVAQVGQSFAPHENNPQAMTVLVDAGRVITNGTLVSQNQQTVSGFTAASSTQRIDRIVVDEFTGLAARIVGTESASPAAPTIPAGKIAVCQIGPFTTSTAIITNAMITDERSFYKNYAVSRMDVDRALRRSRAFGAQNLY